MDSSAGTLGKSRLKNKELVSRGFHNNKFFNTINVANFDKNSEFNMFLLIRQNVVRRFFPASSRHSPGCFSGLSKNVCVSRFYESEVKCSGAISNIKVA